MLTPQPYWLYFTAWCLPIVCHAGPAINQFEMKDLEVEVGQWEFQSQNAHSWNQPEREFIQDTPGDFEYDDNSVVRQRHALELEVGILEWLRSRVGMEFEKERIDEPPSFARRNNFDSLKLEEVAWEGVAVFIPIEDNGAGLGLLVEYQHLLEREEANSIVVGPIIEAIWDRWTLLLNPAVVQFFGGDSGDNKLDFTYAATIIYRASSTWDLAVEAYGTVDRLGSSGSRTEEARLFGDHDLHRLGPIAYLRQRWSHEDNAYLLSLGLGLFVGLNDNTPEQTLKWSVEFEF